MASVLQLSWVYLVFDPCVKLNTITLSGICCFSGSKYHLGASVRAEAIETTEQIKTIMDVGSFSCMNRLFCQNVKYINTCHRYTYHPSRH
jgi:hypothetical protein